MRALRPTAGLSGFGISGGSRSAVAKDRRPGRVRRALSVRARRLWRGGTRRLSSSLTRRIVVLNLSGLAVLLLLFLYLNQFREGLIAARVPRLETQSKVIPAAIAASASVGSDSLTL